MEFGQKVKSYFYFGTFAGLLWGLAAFIFGLFAPAEASQYFLASLLGLAFIAALSVLLAAGALERLGQLASKVFGPR